MNAERGWCAMSHVCWVRRRLVGGQQGRTQMYMGEVSMPGRAGAYIKKSRVSGTDSGFRGAYEIAPHIY